jgi:glyoxylase-like metal-dependent hydrolase (beta-lactamase superfamily II)
MTNVIPIRLSLSNAYLIQGEAGAVLVDSGSPGEAQTILRAMKKSGVDASSLRLILHTHAHIDHAGSSLELRRLTGAPTAIQAADAALLRGGRNGPLPPTRLEARLIKPFVDRPFPALEPDICFDDALDLTAYGVDGRVMQTPGHTAGSISVILGNGDAIVGDVMMGGVLGGHWMGRRPNFHYFAQDLDAVRRSVSALLRAAPERFLVGHGGPLALADVRAFFAAES